MYNQNVSINKNLPSVEHGFTWDELQVLENNSTSFKKRREKEKWQYYLNIIKTVQPWRYIPLSETSNVKKSISSTLGC